MVLHTFVQCWLSKRASSWLDHPTLFHSAGMHTANNRRECHVNIYKCLVLSLPTCRTANLNPKEVTRVTKQRELRPSHAMPRLCVVGAEQMCSLERTSKPKRNTYNVTEPSYLRAQASTAPESLANSSRLPHFKRPPLLSCVKHCMRPILSFALEAAFSFCCGHFRRGALLLFRHPSTNNLKYKRLCNGPKSDNQVLYDKKEVSYICQPHLSSPAARQSMPVGLPSTGCPSPTGCKGLSTLARLAPRRSYAAQLVHAGLERKMLVHWRARRLGCHRRQAGRRPGRRASGWLQGLAEGQHLGGGRKQLLHGHQARLLEQRACGSSLG